jgi:hypothetical protein
LRTLYKTECRILLQSPLQLGTSIAPEERASEMCTAVQSTTKPILSPPLPSTAGELAPHALPVEAVVHSFGIDPALGHSTVEVAKQQAQYGPNSIQGIFRNPFIWAAITIVVLLQFLAIFFSPLAIVLGTTRLVEIDWIVIGFCVVAPVIVVEISKAATNRSVSHMEAKSL